jgi:hypothetical protein
MLDKGNECTNTTEHDDDYCVRLFADFGEFLIRFSQNRQTVSFLEAAQVQQAAIGEFILDMACDLDRGMNKALWDRNPNNIVAAPGDDSAPPPGYKQVLVEQTRPGRFSIVGLSEYRDTTVLLQDRAVNTLRLVLADQRSSGR